MILLVSFLPFLIASKLNSSDFSSISIRDQARPKRSALQLFDCSFLECAFQITDLVSFRNTLFLPDLYDRFGNNADDDEAKKEHHDTPEDLVKKKLKDLAKEEKEAEKLLKRIALEKELRKLEEEFQRHLKRI